MTTSSPAWNSSKPPPSNPPPPDTTFCVFPAQRIPYSAMRCPFCDADKDHLKVIDSRSGEGGRAIRRRRRCLSCGKRFTTYKRFKTLDDLVQEAQNVIDARRFEDPTQGRLFIEPRPAESTPTDENGGEDQPKAPQIRTTKTPPRGKLPPPPLT